MKKLTKPTNAQMRNGIDHYLDCFVRPVCHSMINDNEIRFDIDSMADTVAKALIRIEYFDGVNDEKEKRIKVRKRKTK